MRNSGEALLRPLLPRRERDQVTGSLKWDEGGAGEWVILGDLPLGGAVCRDHVQDSWIVAFFILFIL